MPVPELELHTTTVLTASSTSPEPLIAIQEHDEPSPNTATRAISLAPEVSVQIHPSTLGVGDNVGAAKIVENLVRP